MNNSLIKLGPILLLWTFTAFSQNLNITFENDNNVMVQMEMSDTIGNSLNIDGNGNVNVVTSKLIEDLGNDLGLQNTGTAPLLNFIKSVDSVSSATLEWTIQNDAVYCLKSGLWEGLIQGSTIIANNQAFNENVIGNGIYELQCSNAFGSSVVEQVTVANYVPPIAPTLSFSATTPTTINAGGSVTFSWTIANSATSCIKSGAWSGNVIANKITNGTHNETIDNINISGNYELQCFNTNGSSDKLPVLISVSGDVVPAFCLSNPDINPAGLQRDETFTVYQNDNGLKQWPVENDSFSITVVKNKYLALKFKTPVDSDQYGDFEGAVSFVTTNQGPLDSGKTFSVSLCPGDFRAELGGCLRHNNNATFSWTNSEIVPGGYAGCQLQDDTTYYFNYINAENAPDFDTTTCPAPDGGSCGKFIVNNSGG